MAVKIYKKGGVIIIEGVYADKLSVNPSKFDWQPNSNIYSVRDGIENQTYELGVFGNVQNEEGTPFSSNEELETYLSDLSASNSVLVNSDGKVNSEQHPLSVDGDSVHAKDIDVKNSIMGNFSGEPTCFFDDLHSENIDSTANNPKTVLIHFHRTTVVPLIGVGSSEGGGFSNVKVIGILSGNIETVLSDHSNDDTDRTTFPFQFPNTGLNALKLEFHTADEIAITNIYIPKVRVVAALPERLVKYATSYNAPYMLNEASQSMVVDGSSTPVDFKYTVGGFASAGWQRSFIDLQDGSQDFQPENFGAINNGLTNGVEIIVQKDGVEYIMEVWKTNMDISMTCFDFNSPYKPGAYIGRWTIPSDLGSPITLFSGDEIIIRINDNLTTLDAFRFRVKLSQ